MGAGGRRVIRAAPGPLLALALALACGRTRPHSPDEHAELGAAFAAGDSAALRRMLHLDVVVQPPEPDRASRGGEAIDYLLGLAAATEVSESRFQPTGINREGPFLLEEGTWFMGHPGRILRARYLLRWRPSEEGWRIVLLRWTRFR